MGFIRLAKKAMSPHYRIYSTVKKMQEHGVVEGVKEEIKEDIQDNPLTNYIYRQGKHEGKKEGYSQASNEYEQKLLKQAEQFTTQTRIFEGQRSEYEKLLDEYETYIERMNSKNHLSPQEQSDMNDILIMERQLKKLDN